MISDKELVEMLRGVIEQVARCPHCNGCRQLASDALDMIIASAGEVR